MTIEGDDRPDPFSQLRRFKAKQEGAEEPSISVDIDKLASDNSFPSREAKPENPGKRRRFGENDAPTDQLNFRAKISDKERFYNLAEKHGYKKLGDFFEKMLDTFEALEKKS